MTGCNIKNDLDTENRRLLNRDKQFAKMSVEKGAAEAFRHFLTEDAMGMAPNQHPVIGRDNLYAEMKPGQRLYVLNWEPQRATVSASEDMGWTWGTYTLTGKDADGMEQINHGKYLNIWERQDDGQWLVAVDMGNTSPAPEE
jgi:ketosteroid isomerase-like protein